MQIKGSSCSTGVMEDDVGKATTHRQAVRCDLQWMMLRSNLRADQAVACVNRRGGALRGMPVKPKSISG